MTAVYLAARTPGGHQQAAPGSAPGAAAVGTGSRSPVPTGEREPERSPSDQAAA